MWQFAVNQVADPYHFDADADPNYLFTMMQIRILLLIRVIRICDHPHTDPPQLHF